MPLKTCDLYANHAIVDEHITILWGNLKSKKGRGVNEIRTKVGNTALVSRRVKRPIRLTMSNRALGTLLIINNG